VLCDNDQLILHASTGFDRALVRIGSTLESSALSALGRLSYTIEWCEAGEKLARACLRNIRDNLE
jgi:hypothetical protein